MREFDEIPGLKSTADAATGPCPSAPQTPAPSLLEVAQHVPLGHTCRSCGTSTYNILVRLGDYIETGEPCCSSLAKWVALAKAGEPPVTAKHKAWLAERDSQAGPSHPAANPETQLHTNQKDSE